MPVSKRISVDEAVAENYRAAFAAAVEERDELRERVRHLEGHIHGHAANLMDQGKVDEARFWYGVTDPRKFSGAPVTNDFAGDS